MFDNISVSQAIAMQKELASHIITRDILPDPIKTIAGLDVGYNKKQQRARAAYVEIDRETKAILFQDIVESDVHFPYRTGLLSFREIPAVEKLLNKLKTLPPLIMVDGQGVAHPRGLGLASHIGVLWDVPTIGIAKKKLVGHFEMPGPEKGAATKLYNSSNQQIGHVMRSRDHVKPLFISPGHKISFDTALNLTLEMLTRYRLPAPTRLADKLSKFTKDLKNITSGK